MARLPLADRFNSLSQTEQSLEQFRLPAPEPYPPRIWSPLAQCPYPMRRAPPVADLSRLMLEGSGPALFPMDSDAITYKAV